MLLKLNETPVRTSKNYNINNIKIENIEVPEEIKEFKNLEVKCETSKIIIEKQASNVKLNYGLNEMLISQVNEQANQKLKIIIDSKVDKEIQLIFKLNEENSVLVDNIEIIANKDTKATVIIKYISKKSFKGFHNGVIKAIASKGANINIIVVNLLSLESSNLLSIENQFEDNSKINYTIVDFGGAHSITNYYSNLLGEESDNHLNTIYLGKENQIFDLNYIAELRGARANIDIEVEGALKDVAKKHFKGTIDFKKGCKKATGNENEACMLLSNTAKSIALPMLLCSEEQVEGNHSNSAGKIGEKELFYIMSRGFELKEAMKLMVRAKFNKVLENIHNEELRNEIFEEINERLN